MSLWGKLLGSDKIIDGGMKAIDKAFYTAEEKADDHNKRMSLKALLLKAYEPFKVAQRFLALIYGIPYVIAWTVTFFASFFKDVSVQFEFLADSRMATANMIILAFYFGGGAAESIYKFGIKK